MRTNPSEAIPNRASNTTASSRLLRNAAQALVTSAALVGAASAEPTTGHWVDTWTASAQPTWAADALPLAKDIPDSLADSTVRQIVRASIGGERLRVVLSNEYGTTPLKIGGVQVAKSIDETFDVDRSTNRIVTFGGRETTTIPAGVRMVSDPVAMQVAPLARLSVSLYLPEYTPLTTFHWDGRQHAAVVSGNRLASGRLAEPSMLDARLFLSDVLVDAPLGARSVVALGDSITDGRGATIDADRRWTDCLARRLAHDHTAVLNAGISGARMLRDGMGVNALARLDRDVLSRPGVRTVVVLLGTNDIGWPGSSFAPHDAPMTAQAIIDGYRQLIERAHMRGIRVVGGTIAPFEGALEGTPIHGYYTNYKDAVRRQVNAWIRESGAFDAVVDFDAVLRDPAQPTRMLARFDCGDHLHPNDAGDAEMAAALTDEVLFGHAQTASR
jgi:lysophospholipase L1-like esterase